MRKFFPLLLVIIVLTSCQNELREKGTPEYISEIKEWHKKRIENLKKENGWLNLVGLLWLNEGENKFGSDQSNNLVFPEGKAEPFMGSFFLKDSTVTIEINKNVKVFLKDGGQIEKMILRHDQQPETTVLSYGSLRWFVIKRGDRYGIRLRDLEADLVKNFSGIETYPVNSDWKFEAKFEKYDPPKKIAVPNILGTIDEEKSPGALVFSKDGKEYKVDALDEGDSYFLIFADETSGIETYGGGRFLYTPKADSTGKLLIDFNRAYNPPCVFTKYATCPLPPKQNHLKMQITAGEKNYGHGH
ncbi:MAG: DUF1684 domain-containing protein [Ignavibacteriales bacterium]|nr:DUF1684 domain-containing protein [Ignavibacteriales bacterium]